MTSRVILAALALTAGAAIFLVSTQELIQHRAIERANEHMSWGRLERADEVLAGAIAKVPLSPRLHKERAQVLNALGRWRNNQTAAENSHIELGIAASLNPLDGMAWGEYGESLRRAGQPQLAIAALQRGLERDPNNVYLLGLLGQAQMDIGDASMAVVTFERAQSIRRTSQIGTLLQQAREQVSGNEEQR